MCCGIGKGSGKRYRVSISFEFNTPQWLNCLTSGAGWHISSLSINDLVDSKVTIRSFPPIQKLRAHRGHSLTRAKSSPNLGLAKRKSRSWLSRKTPQQEACENWVSQTVCHEYEDPNYDDLHQPYEIYENPYHDEFEEPYESYDFQSSYYDSYNERMAWIEPRAPKFAPLRPLRRRNSCKHLRPSAVPPRSTSLPFWQRTIEIISQPSAPIDMFQFNQHEGPYFQSLSNGSIRISCRSLVLQLSHIEPCIRHIALATAMIRQRSQTAKFKNNHCISGQRNTALKHYTLSKQYLRARLARVRGRADMLTWTTSLLATLLYTEFRASIWDVVGANMHLEAGLGLTNTALAKFGTGGALPQLPGPLREIALEFRM